VVEAIQIGAALGVWPAPTFDVDRLDAALRQTAVDTVERTRSRLARPGLDVSGEVMPGRAATAIVDAAGSLKADLIVMGSRGHGTIESMVLGSVSAEVVDHARVPVLVARDGAIDRVVLGWDGSAGARAAADILTAWPMFSRSAVRVVCVAGIEVPWWTGFPQPGSPETVPMVLEAAEASRTTHEAMARDMADELRAAGLAAVPERRDGDAATAIIAAATETRAGLIVLGTRGRTGLARLVLGSVARNVLHHATCSVLVVREPNPRI
jgi:nucleotide-binding universal stress UspA family protein